MLGVDDVIHYFLFIKLLPVINRASGCLHSPRGKADNRVAVFVGRRIPVPVTFFLEVQPLIEPYG